MYPDVHCWLPVVDLRLPTANPLNLTANGILKKKALETRIRSGFQKRLRIFFQKDLE
jgi:hypothetical protein